MALTVRHASTRSEIWRWYWRAWRRKLWVTHAIVFVLVFGVALLCFWEGNAIRPASVAIATAFGLAAISWFPLFPLTHFKPQTRTLTVDDTGLSTVIGNKSGDRPWAQIDAVSDEGDAVVITGKNKNTFIVPARAFESAQARAQSGLHST